MADAATIRNFFGKCCVEDGSMGRGCILVVKDERLGDYPLASVNVPFKSQDVNRAVAEFLANAWNSR